MVCYQQRIVFIQNKTNKMQRVYYPQLSEANFGSTWIKDMIRLHDGSVIFSTFSGLYQIKKENEHPLITLYSKLNEIYDKSFDALFQDEAGNIYVAGDDSLYILKPLREIKNRYCKKQFYFHRISVNISVIQFKMLFI